MSEERDQQNEQARQEAEAAGHVDLGKTYAIDESEVSGDLVGTSIDAAEATDAVTWVVRGPEGDIRVGGPDPSVWGDDTDRPVAAVDQASDDGVDIGQIKNEGEPNQVNGPGEYWRGRQATPEPGR